jgi:hypothetical protein
MASVVTHELEEATTDADPRCGCAWTFGQTLHTAANGARNLKQVPNANTCNVSLTPR